MKKDSESSTDLVATIVPPEGEQQILVYNDATPSGTIIQDSTSYVGATLEAEYVEAITESVERSRGLMDGGFKFRFKLPEKFGGFAIELEKKPRKET